MTKEEAIEIIDQAHKGNAIKEDFFKTPYEIVSETLDKYAESVNKSDIISGVSGIIGTDEYGDIHIADNSDDVCAMCKFTSSPADSGECLKCCESKDNTYYR